jgi:uncharacterized protein
VNLIWKLLIGLVASLVGVFAAEALNIPLPWTLGPLLAVALLRLLSVPISSAKPLRNFGQIVIGITLGLYFTPKVVTVIGSHWVAILAGVLLAFFLSAYGTFVLHRFGKVDIKTAWFSSAIGGANEMAILAERYKTRVDLVVSAHTTRVLLVVMAVPIACQFFGVSGFDTDLLEQRSFDAQGLAFLALISVIVGFVAHYFRMPNAWVIGPMLVSIIFTVAEVHLSSMPNELSKLAQLLLGWSLGDRFRPGFFKTSPKFLTSVVVFSFTALGLAFGYAALVSVFTGIPTGALVVSVAPGGIAEMAITAKVLQLGVPLVTAFQVFRMVGVVLLTGPIYKYVVLRYWPDTTLSSNQEPPKL